MLDPAAEVTWEADLWCDDCREDRPHMFARLGGSTVATCEDCEWETIIDPDDFDGPA